MLRLAAYLFLAAGALFVIARTAARFSARSVRSDVIERISEEATQGILMDNNPTSVATFGNGCFWCTEAVFESIPGVLSVTSGYSGGAIANPTYREVCNGMTGHAEVIQVKYDPSQITYTDLLRAFWQSHDPTTPNRQGNDVGDQYRSVVFFHDQPQKKLAEFFKQELNSSNAFGAAVVTEIAPFQEFYAAEAGHQDYFVKNKSKGYCRMLIQPKLEKFKKVFRKDSR